MQKARAREDVRGQVPELAGEEYNFMFLPSYQSTEESEEQEIEDALDPASENERAARDPQQRKRAPGRRVKEKRKVLVVRPPGYRAARVSDTPVPCRTCIRC